MTVEERKKWLEDNESSVDMDIAEIEGCEVEGIRQFANSFRLSYFNLGRATSWTSKKSRSTKYFRQVLCWRKIFATCSLVNPDRLVYAVDRL